MDDLKAKTIQSLVDLRQALDNPSESLIPEISPSAGPGCPTGWEIVGIDMLTDIRAKAPTLDVMVQFFDGILPTWQLALAPGVQPRAVAERLANRFRAVHTGATKPKVVLLAGAGGEGKSTAVLHAAAALVEDKHHGWTCLRRQAANADLPDDTFSKLPVIPAHAWVVVIDDADNVVHGVLAALSKIPSRTDIHLLLASRDTEWQLKRAVPSMWQPQSDFHTEHLAGLDEEDARRIVSGWIAWGDTAMGKLKGQTKDAAIAALLGHARDLAARKEDGELLGALLITRQGEDMQAHVRTLVSGLDRSPAIKTHSLRDIYTMVSAMHAENQLYLSRSVLAFALGCEIDELERKALTPLRREAMLDAGDTYILGRHRRIAEAACSVMREDGDDLDRWYSFLARAALRAFKANAFFVFELHKWNFDLASYFFEKGERFWPIARNIMKAVYETNPDEENLTALASVLRRTGRASEAIAVLRTNGHKLRDNRSGIYEWGTVAGAAGDQGLSAWLDGRSLADGGETIDQKRCKFSLAGLGLAFRELFAISKDKAFAAGQASCGQLGLRLEGLDATTRGYFEKHAAEGRRNGIADLSPQQSVNAVAKAVVLGANEVKPDNDPVFFERLLGEPEGYRYTGLLRIVEDEKSAVAARAPRNKSYR